MKKIRTRDNSFTLYSKEYSETYHSKSGAFEEAFGKFVKPCKIKAGMKVLDICFGLGYNCAAALHTTKDIKIISFEKNPDVLKEIKSIKVPDFMEKDYNIIKEVAEKHFYKKNNTEVQLIIGDAIIKIKNIKEKFDAVFLDPFSPPKNPELWSLEFLSEIFKRMKIDGIVATYSCARLVRDNLKNAGFRVLNGPIIGRRSPGTVALKML